MSLYFFQNLLEPKIQFLCSVSAHVNEVVPDIIWIHQQEYSLTISISNLRQNTKYYFSNFGQFTYRWVRLTRSHDIQQLHCFPHPHLNASDVLKSMSTRTNVDYYNCYFVSYRNCSCLFMSQCTQYTGQNCSGLTFYYTKIKRAKEPS